MLKMEIYMKTLDGFVKDEDKLVTYKWLSNELEIHVNVAKQILEEYWNRHKNNGIVATIMMIGYLENGEMRVELVKEQTLSNALKKYNKIVSQHVYSLQKSLSDIELLVGVGKCDARFGAISCDKSVLFTDKELFARRWGSTDMAFHAPPEARKPSIDKSADAKKSNGIGKFLKEPAENRKLLDEDANNKKEEKLEEKKISPPKNKTSPKKGANSKKPVQSQKKGLSNLFSKVPSANQKKSPHLNVVDKDTSRGIEAKSINENVNNMNNLVEKPIVENVIKSPSEEKSVINESSKNVKSPSLETKSAVIPRSESKSNKNKKTNRGTKRERSHESKVDSKKRKRIFVVADSSEESAASDEEMICDSPPHEEIVETKKKSPSPSPVQNINGKRKIRKLVDKKYVDEDGYLVTKKEYIYESCSEEDEPINIPEPIKKHNELPAKVTKKQTTLMNFFKKA